MFGALVFTLLSQAQATEESADVQAIEQQLRRQDKALAIQERIQPVGRVHIQPSATGAGGNAAPAATQALTATAPGNSAPAIPATTASSPVPASAPIPAANTAATPAAVTTTDKTATGEKIYNTYCVACHATGVANAPKLGDKSAWQPRIAAEKTTAGGFLATVKKGKTAMPPMGMCSNCSDEDLQAAINYLLEKVK